MSGGVVCLIHRSVQRFFQLIEYNCDNTVIFKISKEFHGGDNDILMFNVYVPPIGSPYYEVAGLNNGIDILCKSILDVCSIHENCSLIICGDFNARTGSLNTNFSTDFTDMFSNVLEESRLAVDSTVNDFGEHLLEMCMGLELTILNGCVDKYNSCGYTFVSSQGCSTVDYCIVSKDLIHVFESLSINSSVLSPHMSLSLVLRVSSPLKPNEIPKNSGCNKLVWDDSLVNTFTDNLSEHLSYMEPLNRSIEVDVNFLTETITSCLVHAAGVMQKSFRPYLPIRGCRWFDKECRAAKKETSKCLRRFLHSHSSQDRVIYLRHRNDYKQLLRMKKCTYRQNVTQDIVNSTRDSKLFWKQIKSLRTVNTVANIDPETWLQHFQSVFSLSNSFDDCTIYVSREICAPDYSILNSEITQSEISDAVNYLKKNKSAGADGILSEMLKCSQSMLMPHLHSLFNAIFDQGLFPSLWTHSLIVPIHKKGPLNDPNNFRGISLTSIFSKTFLHILNARLQTWADENNIIGEEQAGCRRGYSTVDNVFILYNVVQRYLSRNKKLFVLFVDFQKAFDTVNRQALWKVLEGSGVQGKMLKMLKAVYKTVKCSVRCQGQAHGSIDCHRGLKQGCKLSPLLFSFLVSHLCLEVIGKGKHGVQLKPNGSELFLLLFVDDIVLLSDTVPGLQNQINNLKNAADKLGLLINMEKTKVVVFRNGGFIAAHEKWMIGDIKLEVATQYKYLGVTLSTKLCTNTILSDLVTRAKAASIQILRSLRKLTVVTPDVLFRIFDAQVQPILLYGSEIWGNYECKRIETVHMFVMKWFLNVAARTPNVMIYGDTGRYPLGINTQLRLVKYWLKLLKMDHDRYPHQVYTAMLNSVDSHFNWATGVKSILRKYDFEREWDSQLVQNETSFLKSLKNRIIEKYRNDWRNSIQSSVRYSFYKLVKVDHSTEPYLYALDKRVFRDALIRFRMGISDLFVHKYRYSTFPFVNLCPLCMEKEEDEVHFLLYCPATNDIRIQYLLKYVQFDAFDPLLNIFLNNDVCAIRNIATYLYKAFRRRAEALPLFEDSDLLESM